MAATANHTRCTACRRPLPFADWTTGRPLCQSCSRPLGDLVREIQAPPRTPAEEAAAYERILDTMPDALMDELIAALEAEAQKLDQLNPVAGVLTELDLGRTPRERRWAAWGFAAGFALNIAIAKWAQVASAAPLSEFLAPMLIGGLVAGTTCAAIGWGLARLRSPA